MSVKALEELRELGTKVKESCFTGVHCDAVLSLADEIEAEIEREWMRVPVDADGVPIHVGDELEGGFTVDYVAPHWVLAAGRGAKHEDSCRHVKPRTIEDVLRDVVTLCANTWKDEKSAFRYYDVGNVMESGNIADFAAEIRELMGAES